MDKSWAGRPSELSASEEWRRSSLKLKLTQVQNELRTVAFTGREGARAPAQVQETDLSAAPAPPAYPQVPRRRWQPWTRPSTPVSADEHEVEAVSSGLHGKLSSRGPLDQGRSPGRGEPVALRRCRRPTRPCRVVAQHVPIGEPTAIRRRMRRDDEANQAIPDPSESLLRANVRTRS